MSGSDGRERSPALGNALAVLVALLLCCLIVGAIAYSQGIESERRYQAPHRHAEYSETDAKVACTGLEPEAMFECVQKKVEDSEETARAEQDLTAQQRAATSALVAAIVSALTLAISGIGVWYVKRTLDATVAAVADTSQATQAMLKANEIAERNARKGLRPYLWPEAAWFKMTEEGEPIAQIVIKNFGQTPALNKRGWTHTWVECFPLHDPLPEAPADMMMGSSVIGPGAISEATQDHGRPLNAYSLAEIEAGRAALYVYGFGTYVSLFGKEHFYRFIYFTTGNGALERGRLQPYMSGNVIDAE